MSARIRDLALHALHATFMAACGEVLPESHGHGGAVEPGAVPIESATASAVAPHDMIVPDTTSSSEGGLILGGPDPCGNGILDEDEACDDGNTMRFDGCDGTCQVEPFCGDGLLDQDETCDDGNTVRGDGCSSCDVVDQFWKCPTPGEACALAFTCGDASIGGPELCDDGNTTSGDGCSTDCVVEDGWWCGAEGKPCRRFETVDSVGVREDAGVRDSERCGDGVVNGGEACDDGALNGPEYGGCLECMLGPYCGDGVVDVDEREQCDNGINMDLFIEDEASCAPGCRVPTCGDGVVQAQTEQCDSGRDPTTGQPRNNGGYGGCNRNCTFSARCGDGVVDAGIERCDDGNRRSDDGCDMNCQPDIPGGRIDR